MKGIVQAEIAVEDDFPLDNRAYGVVAARPGSSWWERAIIFSKRCSLVSWFAGERRAPGRRGALHACSKRIRSSFLTVCSPLLRRGNFLLLNTTPQDPRLPTQGTVTRPQVLDWQRQHPCCSCGTHRSARRGGPRRATPGWRPEPGRWHGHLAHQCRRASIAPGHGGI